ncbi:PIG-L family deacetylase [Oceanobacillus piezotolerans]|uniref:PIG-L family deacetylase n=1 Tax=Oceanobacillus piezotolerans TaxID=2448030 RepID=A0A498DGS3_9BACI|nr:PIG-L deacetylase family protein [Oceanobacillus piezotolerans]RLL48388.1 PIG-L family deacetylase [Oceanobacillus piezotolerans]
MLSIEIPNPFKMNRALFIQPHPDYNDISAGGTIAKLIDAGTEVHYLTVTNGSSGNYNTDLSNLDVINIRRREQEKAGTILGVKHYHLLNFQNGHLFDNEELRKEIVYVIRKVKPDIIFTVDPFLKYETHIDHIVTGRVASFAARISPNPRFYPEQLQKELNVHRVKAIAYYTTNHPNTYINIDRYLEKKMEAIQAHTSQFSGEYLTYITNYFTEKAKQVAKQVKDECSYAECFKILSPTLLHSNVDAISM